MRSRDVFALLEMRTDSEAFERLDPADRWLAKYTYENLDKWPNAETLRVLAERYPVTAPQTVYRGINFTSREQWEEFEEKLNRGEMTFNGVTSWGRDGDSVEQFAVTRPSYFLDRDTMVAYGKAREEREYIAGHRGIVIKTTVKPGQGINVNQSGLGHEDEIILLPGTYPVEVHRHLKRYRDTLDDNDTTIDDVIATDHEGPYDVGFRDFVLHHHIGDLNDRSRETLYARACRTIAERNRNPTTYECEIKAPTRWSLNPNDPTVVHFRFIAGYFTDALKGHYPERVMPLVRKQAALIAKQIIRDIKKNPDFHLDLHPGVRAVAKLSGLEDQMTQAINAHVGRQYRAHEAEGRKINQMDFKDKWDMENTVRAHGEKSAAILQQMMF